MRVLFVINDLSRAGAEKQVTLLAKGLKSRGFDVSIVLLKERNDFREVLEGAAIPVMPLRRTGPFDAGIVLRLRRAIQASKPDVVVSFLFLANLFTVLATRLLKARPRVVVSVRESYVRDFPLPLRLIARTSHLGADAVLCNSLAVLREERSGFPAHSHLEFLANAVEAAAPLAVDWLSHGIAARPVVVSVGQLAPVKGHRMLIEAFATIARESGSTHLVLVGDGPEKESLQRRVAELGLGGRVAFLGHQADPLPFMAAADVFVQPSLSEGMSNALLEAMALGRCIVATRVGAASEMLEDGIHGLLCPPSTSAVAGALIRVLKDPGLRERLGAAAGERARDFSVEKAASGLDRVLRG